MHKYSRRYVFCCCLALEIYMVMAVGPNATAIAQAPLLIPDNTGATCVIFGFVVKK